MQEPPTFGYSLIFVQFYFILRPLFESSLFLLYSETADRKCVQFRGVTYFQNCFAYWILLLWQHQNTMNGCHWVSLVSFSTQGLHGCHCAKQASKANKIIIWIVQKFTWFLSLRLYMDTFNGLNTYKRNHPIFCRCPPTVWEIPRVTGRIGLA